MSTTTDAPIYIGKSASGKLHIVTERGWSECGRSVGNATLAHKLKPAVDANWCGSCFATACANYHWSTLLSRATTARERDQEAFDTPECYRSPPRSTHTDAAVRWDGDAEIEIGELILAHLERHEPPEGSRCAADFEKWGEALVRSGNNRLEATSDGAS